MRRGRISWVTRIPARRLRSVNAAIDGGALSSRAVYDRCDLGRWLALSTFRKYVTARRRDRATRRENSVASEAPDLVALECELFAYLLEKLQAGTLKPSMLAEVRLFLRDLERRRQSRPDSGAEEKAAQRTCGKP